MKKLLKKTILESIGYLKKESMMCPEPFPQLESLNKQEKLQDVI